MNTTSFSGTTRANRRRGHSLVEVMVVSTIMGILGSIPMPMFAKAIEQSKLDMAASNVRAIWCAERYFYIENGRYGSLAELSPASDSQGASLLDPSIASGTTFYAYSINVGDGQSFTATAQHPVGFRYAGSLTIDHTGKLTCSVANGSVTLSPSLEPQS